MISAPENWSVEGPKVKGSAKEARLINEHLGHLKSKILEADKKLLKTDIEITTENLRNELLGIDSRKRMLIPIFKDHNKKVKELVGKGFASGTLERYETSLKHTVEFLEWKYQISDIDITKIDHAFITDYEFVLRSIRNCNNNTLSSTSRTIIKSSESVWPTIGFTEILLLITKPK